MFWVIIEYVIWYIVLTLSLLGHSPVISSRDYNEMPQTCIGFVLFNEFDRYNIIHFHNNVLWDCR